MTNTTQIIVHGSMGKTKYANIGVILEAFENFLNKALTVGTKGQRTRMKNLMRKDFYECLKAKGVQVDE